MPLVIAVLLTVIWAMPGWADEQALADAQALQNRAQAFWDAKVNRDYAAEYYLVELGGRPPTLAEYIKLKGSLQFVKAQVEGVQIDGDKAIVRVCLLVESDWRDQEKPVRGQSLISQP